MLFSVIYCSWKHAAGTQRHRFVGLNLSQLEERSYLQIQKSLQRKNELTVEHTLCTAGSGPVWLQPSKPTVVLRGSLGAVQILPTLVEVVITLAPPVYLNVVFNSHNEDFIRFF